MLQTLFKNRQLEDEWNLTTAETESRGENKPAVSTKMIARVGAALGTLRQPGAAA